MVQFNDLSCQLKKPVYQAQETGGKNNKQITMKLQIQNIGKNKKTKSWSFGKLNKIDKPLARPIKKKKSK